jgi:CBS domain-containing protein
MARSVRDLMTTRLVSVRSDDPVATAVELMAKYGFGALPVVIPGARLVGVVSLLDVIRYREEHDERGLDADEDVPVAEIMNPDVVSMSANANVSAVARRLAESGQLRMLPVVQGGKLVGVVTRSDLLRDASAGPRPGGLGRLLGLGRDDTDDADELALQALAGPRRAGPPAAPDSPVREVMTSRVVTVAADDPVLLAAELMLRDRHTSLPVVEADGRLVGVISEADILADPYAGRRANATVSGVMTRGAISIDVDATVGEARSLVADRGVRNLPVVERGVLVGVLSRSDLV